MVAKKKPRTPLQTRRVHLEGLEPRQMMAADLVNDILYTWQNNQLPCDVSGDGLVSPRDALIVVNHVLERGEHAVQPTQRPPYQLDVDGNGRVDLNDAKAVIDHLLAKPDSKAGEDKSGGHGSTEKNDSDEGSIGGGSQSNNSNSKEENNAGHEDGSTDTTESEDGNLQVGHIVTQFVVHGHNREIKLDLGDADLSELDFQVQVEGQDVPFSAEVVKDTLVLTAKANYSGTFTVTLTVKDQDETVTRKFRVVSGSYEAVAYARMFHPFADGGFRDQYGFIVTNDGGQPGDRGDAVIFTGLATVVAALAGDAATVESLLKTLRDQPWWVNDSGDTQLIRHPDVWDYIKSGDTYVRDRKAPLSKDGIVGVMTALHYAYSSREMSDEVRSLAREVMQKYIDYLISHDWKTLDKYPDHYWDKSDKDKKKFAHVYSNESGGAVMWKGPESFALSPSDRFALKNVAAEMGFTTAGWNVWAGFGGTLADMLGDAVAKVAEDVAKQAGNQLDKLLQEIAIHHKYSFHVIPGVNWTLVKGSLDVEISKSDRQNIVGAFEDGVRNIVSTLAKAPGDATTFLLRFNDLLGRAVDSIVNALPKWLAPDKWRAAVNDTLAQALPWFTGEVFGELVAFRLAHELSKMDEINAHLSFWPTLLMYETRPDMASLLSFSVKDLDGYINGQTAEYQNDRTDAGDSPDFWVKSLYRMDMMLYAWLAGDGGKVAWWLNKFETDSRFENLAYAWKKPHSENVEKILAGDEEGAEDAKALRLDYLLLKHLERHGVPGGLGDAVGDWLKHWNKMLQNVVSQLEQRWIELRDNVIKFARALRDEFGAGLGQIARVLREELGAGLIEIAKVLKNEFGAAFTEVARVLRNELGAGLGDVAKILYRELGAGLGQVAKLLKNELGAGLLTVANILRNELGAGLVQIAQTLRSELSASLTTIARTLWDLGNSRLQIANVLWNMGGNTRSQIATALWNGVGGKLSEVAYAIWKGAGGHLSDVANALWNMGGNARSQIANALWNMGGVTRSQIATAIWNGIGGKLSEVAYAIWKGIGGYLSDVATALWYMGGNARSQIANALWNMGGVTRSQIAYALWHGIGGKLSEVATALWKGIGGYMSDVANALWHMGGNTLAQVSYALWHGIGGKLTDIAVALWNGVGGKLSSIARALWDMGGITIGNVAYALWHMGGNSRAQVAGTLMAAFGLSSSGAWSIVYGL